MVLDLSFSSGSFKPTGSAASQSLESSIGVVKFGRFRTVEAGIICQNVGLVFRSLRLSLLFDGIADARTYLYRVHLFFARVEIESPEAFALSIEGADRRRGVRPGQSFRRVGRRIAGDRFHIVSRVSVAPRQTSRSSTLRRSTARLEHDQVIGGLMTLVAHNFAEQEDGGARVREAQSWGRR